jgi:hypothetical protein
MILNSNLPGFYGYYGSIFEDTDTSGEVDYINELRKENGLDPLEDENLINWDYDTYYSELNKKLTGCVEDFIIELGIVKSITFVALHSPKFFNFSNDVIECKINVNVREARKYINDNLEAFEVYLADNFKSRDGFTSFYSHDLNFWLEKMKSFKNLDHIEINAILDFVCSNEDFDIVDYLYNVGIVDIPFLQAANFDELTTNN